MIVLFIIFYENSKIINKYSNLSKHNEINKYECDQEWEILTDKCYFRKNIYSLLSRVCIK